MWQEQNKQTNKNSKKKKCIVKNNSSDKMTRVKWRGTNNLNQVRTALKK